MLSVYVAQFQCTSMCVVHSVSRLFCSKRVHTRYVFSSFRCVRFHSLSWKQNEKKNHTQYLAHNQVLPSWSESSAKNTPIYSHTSGRRRRCRRRCSYYSTLNSYRLADGYVQIICLPFTRLVALATIYCLCAITTHNLSVIFSSQRRWLFFPSFCRCFVLFCFILFCSLVSLLLLLDRSLYVRVCSLLLTTKLASLEARASRHWTYTFNVILHRNSNQILYRL